MRRWRPSAGWLIGFRAVQGLGAAMLMPQTLTIITNTFPAERRGAAFGVWGAVAGVATIAGPTLGGLLVTAFDWRWIFFVNLPFGVIALVLTFVIIPDMRPGRRHRIDIPGVLLASAGLLAICYGLVEGQKYNWGTITSFISIPLVLGLGVLLLIAFLVQQWLTQDREPLVPFALFRDRNYAVVNWVSGTLAIGMMGIFLPFTIYLQSVLGFSALRAGLTMAPASLLSMFVAPVAGRLTDKIGGKYILMLGLILFGGGMGWVALEATTTFDVVRLPARADRGRDRDGLRVRAHGYRGHAEHRPADGRRGVRRAEHRPAGRPGHRHRGRGRAAAEPAGLLDEQPGRDAREGPAARSCAGRSWPGSSTRPATGSRSGRARTAPASSSPPGCPPA